MRRQVMIRAHQIRREYAETHGLAVADVLFGPCLSMAWAEVRAHRQQLADTMMGRGMSPRRVARQMADVCGDDVDFCLVWIVDYLAGRDRVCDYAMERLVWRLVCGRVALAA